MEKAERAAETEAIFRDVNETFLEQSDSVSDETDVLCECSNDSCAELIHISHMEYEAVRSQPTHFLVVPGHVEADIEAVVHEHPGYWIITKVGKAAEIAAERDPRS